MNYKTKVIPGIMWIWDREMFMDWKTYNYWMNHALPFGWAIIHPPQNIIEKSSTMHNKYKLSFLQNRKLPMIIIGYITGFITGFLIGAFVMYRGAQHDAKEIAPSTSQSVPSFLNGFDADDTGVNGFGI